MGQVYDHLRLDERIEIYRLHEDGISLRRIALTLGRSASTISRELRRNSKKTKVWPGGYRADRAHQLALRRRRWDARFKLARQPSLRKLVYDQLAMGWSPQQIAGRLALEKGYTVISYESIYRFIYHRSAQKDYWHRLLPYRKHRRGRIRRGGISPVYTIKHRQPIDKRPECASLRLQEGHWEGDVMSFSKYGQVILVIHERLSRYTKIFHQPNKASRPVVENIQSHLQTLPAVMRRSMTFDNGTEFALHYELHERLEMDTFFCDPHAPWQKGGVENAICRLRRWLPRKIDLDKIEPEQIKWSNDRYNNTPRKCLGYKTPHEVFLKLKERVALQV